jgi:hypothetical protein
LKESSFVKQASFFFGLVLVFSSACADVSDTATRPAQTTDGGSTGTDGGATAADSPMPPPTDTGGTTPRDSSLAFDPDSACVSGMSWAPNARETAAMNPGMACIQCHTQMGEGPIYPVMGTAFYAPHEQDRCLGYYGVPPNSGVGTAYVEVTDAAGTMVRMAVGRSGNFSTRTRLTFPLRTVRVVGPTGLTNEMSQPAPHGDCNLCHTQMGADLMGYGMAPGRITVPL